MRIKDLDTEMNDLLIAIIRSGATKHAVHLFNPMPLADAWLQGEDVSHLRRFKRRWLGEDEAPSRRVAEGAPLLGREMHDRAHTRALRHP